MNSFYYIYIYIYIYISITFDQFNASMRNKSIKITLFLNLKCFNGIVVMQQKLLF